MTGASILSDMGARMGARIGAELSAHWVFWSLFAFALVCVTIAGLAGFERRWLRFALSGALALEAFGLMIWAAGI